MKNDLFYFFFFSFSFLPNICFLSSFSLYSSIFSPFLSTKYTKGVKGWKRNEEKGNHFSLPSYIKTWWSENDLYFKFLHFSCYVLICGLSYVLGSCKKFCCSFGFFGVCLFKWNSGKMRKERVEM